MADINMYVTSRFELDMNDPIIVTVKKATELAKQGKVCMASRTLVCLANPAALAGIEVSDNPYSQIRLDMGLYLNYLQLLRRLATMNNMTEPLNFMKLGYIPILCEPSFTCGLYGQALEPLFRQAGVPLYARNQTPFAKGKISLTGTDYWVSKMDCCDILGMGSAPHLITAEAVLKRLGVTDYETDIRLLY